MYMYIIPDLSFEDIVEIVEYKPWYAFALLTAQVDMELEIMGW